MNEMERIQKGLEEFLENEISDDARKETGGEPEFFAIGEEEEAEKEEIEIISRKKTGNTEKKVRRDAYEEDWDSKEWRQAAKQRKADASRRGNAADRASASRRGNADREDGTVAGRSDRAGASRRGNADREDGTVAGRQGRTDRTDARQQKRRRVKRKKKKSGFIRFLIVLAVFCLALAAFVYFMVGQVYNKMNYEGIGSVSKAPVEEDGVINVLLIGNDSRENGADGRSDAMILLSVSKNTKKIYMTSLLRDMYVEIPGHDGNRLNAAYSYGGAELLMETIEKNLGVTVNRYVLVNFEAFANLVDAVGGVNLELSKEEIELVNGYLWEYNILTERPEGTDYMDASTGGMVHLNGPQALAYSRNRYIGTDFGRTERQRKVLAGVIRQTPKAMLTNPGELMDKLLPNLTTNLTQWECCRLSLKAPQFAAYDIEQASIPLEGTYRDVKIRGMAVLEVDFDANKEYLQKILFDEDN